MLFLVDFFQPFPKIIRSYLHTINNHYIVDIYKYINYKFNIDGIYYLILDKLNNLNTDGNYIFIRKYNYIHLYSYVY